MNDVTIIGGGPAGMIAAIMAARNNNKVLLLEKNEKLGKKLYITGKGRCNVTNASDVEDLLKAVTSNSKFLYSAFYSFDSYMLMNFLGELGLKTKVTRGNRVFPVSEKASDVNKALTKELNKLNVEIKLNQEVTKIVKVDDSFIIKTINNTFKSKKLVIATGGLSYSMTGSTGDGFKFAKIMGHSITPLSPGLVPLEIKEPWIKDLQGLSLKNVNVTFKSKQNKLIYEGFGEMLFTHFGISGPEILSGSNYLPKNNVEGIKVLIDLKPSLSTEQLDERIIKDFAKYSRKNYSNSLGDLLPNKLIPIIIQLSEIDPYKKVDQITKVERKKLVELLKNLTCTIKDRRHYNEAIITRGGINVKEINPNTMESKLIPGLFFAGEVLDLDALTGGYNLQIAFATGYLAGISI